jgi:hypothetical protein
MGWSAGTDDPNGQAASGKRPPTRSRVTFRTLTDEWQATVLPMYKHSTQKHRRFMLGKHLLPRFGDKPICEITRQEIQVYVAHLTRKGTHLSPSITSTMC